MTKTSTIDPEFRSLCPPLTDDERAQLEANLLAEGCRDALVIWQDTLLDGHTRREICEAHGIEFETVEVDGITSREEAKVWIVRNQLGRRNLTPEQASYLRGKRYNAEKRQDLGHGDQRSGRQNDAPKTRERLAGEHNVSPRTIERDGAFAAAVDTIAENAGPEARERILKRESGFPKEMVIKASREPVDMQKWIFSGQQSADRTDRSRQRDTLPNITKLEQISKQPRSVPEGFEQATTLLGTLQQFADFCVAYDPKFVANGVSLPSEPEEVRVLVAIINEWLETLLHELEGVSNELP